MEGFIMEQKDVEHIFKNEKEPENDFKFVCSYCGYQSNNNDEYCIQCGCKQWLYIEDLTPRERENYGID